MGKGRFLETRGKLGLPALPSRRAGQPAHPPLATLPQPAATKKAAKPAAKKPAAKKAAKPAAKARGREKGEKGRWYAAWTDPRRHSLLSDLSFDPSFPLLLPPSPPPPPPSACRSERSPPLGLTLL